MKLHDVTLRLSDQLPTWPGDPPFRRRLATALSRGDPANVSQLDFGAHTGTHVDAPVHFIEGAAGIDGLALDVLVGRCLVISAEPPGNELRPEDLPAGAGERILFKTRNSRHWASGLPEFDREFVSVGEALAAELVSRDVRLVGVDYLSVERFHAPFEHPVHRRLLQAGVVIFEGLDLSAVAPGEYELWCLPLR